MIEVPKPSISEVEFFFSKVTASLNKQDIASKHLMTVYGQLQGLSYPDVAKFCLTDEAENAVVRDSKSVIKMPTAESAELENMG